MALNIKNERTVEAVRQLAELTGESRTGAIEVAVRERLARLTSDGRPGEHAAEARRLLVTLQEIASQTPTTRQQLDDELYDDAGIPR